MTLRNTFSILVFIYAIAFLYPQTLLAQETCCQENKPIKSDVKLSKVIIFRPFKGAGVGGPICVRVDCGPEYLLKVNQYCVYHLPPGEHILWMNYHEIKIDPELIKRWWVLSFKFQVGKQTNYYIQTISGVAKFPTQLIDEKNAKKILERYTPGTNKEDHVHTNPSLLYAY
jgi:hypothetical protein